MTILKDGDWPIETHNDVFSLHFENDFKIVVQEEMLDLLVYLCYRTEWQDPKSFKMIICIKFYQNTSTSQ